MKALKNLAGQTVIYGFGTMVPRLLNYVILTPYFTRLYDTNESMVEYGKVTELYAYIVFLMVILTYGMETAYFRYASKESDKKRVFSTIFTSILITSSLFLILVFLFINDIATILKYEGEGYFILLLAGIVSIDAISAIPFAKLRIENKARKFATLKVIQVSINILAILLFYNFIPYVFGGNSFLLNSNGIVSAKYILLSNLLASALILFFLSSEFKDYCIKSVSPKLYKSLLFYGLPLMLSGLAGVINETLDRVLFRRLYLSEDNLRLLGVYGANYKLAMLIGISIQMFRYAAEPFFFNYEKNKDAKEIYAKVLHIITGFLVFLVLVLTVFIDVFKYFIDPEYHFGLNVVPILATAYIFYGILFNLSVWFKLSNKTNYAILITLVGAAITILINVFFVPRYSYHASAVAHLFSYSAMVIVSYFLGRKFYPIPYKVLRIFIYLALGLVIYLIDSYVLIDSLLLTYTIKTLLLLLFAIFVAWKESLFNIIFTRKHEG